MTKYKVHYYYEDGKYVMRVVAPDVHGCLQVLTATTPGYVWEVSMNGCKRVWDYGITHHILKALIRFDARDKQVDPSQLVFAEGLGE